MNIMDTLNKKYSRIASHVDFDELFNTRLIFIGTGASTHMIEWFARLGIKKFTLCDLDVVEHKNMAAQGFDYDDIGRPKVDAISAKIKRIEFERDNPTVPKLDIITFNQDFLTLTDEEIMAGDGNKILIMASDYHPVQARGSRLALKFEIPTFWVGIYREAMAGEIIFFDNSGAENEKIGTNMPCYRCITHTRYKSFDRHHLEAHLNGNYEGTGTSSGLPMAATFIDSILGHIIVGAIHQSDSGNQHARLYNRLKSEGRNLIQTQLSPEYLLGEEDLFSQITGNDVISFNTLFQTEPAVEDCPDCNHFVKQLTVNCGHAATSTDYTAE